MKRRASQLSILQAKLSLEGKDNPVFLPEDCIVSPADLSKRPSDGSLRFGFGSENSNGSLSGAPTQPNGIPSRKGNPAADNTRI